MKAAEAVVISMLPLFLRTRDAAAALAVSESQLAKWTRAGLLKSIPLPGCRAVRYAREDVEALAARIVEDGMNETIVTTMPVRRRA